MKPDHQQAVIYTDGSCQPNPGPGGWAAIIIEDGRERILKGGNEYSTNNRMELTAALNAIKTIPKNKEIVIFTDSQYLKNGIEKWIENWKMRHWKRKGGVLANVDLWKQLSDEIVEREIIWKWVKGHSGNQFNERVDRLAKEEMQSAG